MWRRQAGAEEAVTLIVAKGQGHNHWEGFFRCQELVDFAVGQAKSAAKAPPPNTAAPSRRPDPVDEWAAQLQPSRLVVYKKGV